MNRICMSAASATFALVLAAQASPARAAAPAHLEKRGMATQLIVDDKPWLALAGELANTASTSLDYMETVWPRLKQMHLNTVLMAVPWAMVEPEEGKFDWTTVDGLLEGARKNDLRIVFLWFGSWKNGISSFVPAWVKADQRRFPRVRVANGKSIEVLSTLSDANRDADLKAYTAFIRHLKEADGEKHTVLMIQMQNEVGLLGDSRDRCDAANKAFDDVVPKELTDYLEKNKGSLNQKLQDQREAAGAKTGGTWKQVFGGSTGTDEIFMAWHYARYMNALAAAGKQEYPIPVYTNTWIVQPEDKGPGDYPSGGPEPFVLDIWKAGAPAIDINAPDIYLPDFAGWIESFHRPDNPLFVPESRGDAAGMANAFLAIGSQDSIGYSPMGIDNSGRLLALRPGPGEAGPADIANLPLPKAYALLGQMAPAILAAQAAGKIAAVALDASHAAKSIKLGDYTVNFEVLRNRRNPDQVPVPGYAIAIEAAPGEYYVAGDAVQVTFAPASPGPAIAGIAAAEQGRFENGQWIPGRMMSGDDILINYKLSEAAAANQSGSGLKFNPNGPSLQRVKLYRYE